MTERREGEAARDRWTPVIVVIGVVALVVGLAMALLPYSKPFQVPDPSIVPVGVDLVVPCKAPLVDAVTADSGGWVNYAPDGSAGAVKANGGRADGDVCTPDSTRRLAIGAFSGAAGVLLLAVGATRLRRDRAERDAPEAAAVSSAPA